MHANLFRPVVAVVVGQLALVAIFAGLFRSATALAHPSCGQLMAVCNGPYYTHLPTSLHRRSFMGPGCNSYCAPTGGNAAACFDSGNTLFAHFMASTDDSAHFCDFNCAHRGSCTIRGATGLPVELLHFGVD